jgi:Ca-activated chloride channel family protein
MPDATLDTFHFLRPWWLLLIPAAIWLHITLRRAVSAADQWQGIIAPELLEHLVLGRGKLRRLRPYQLQTGLILVLSLALAGPAWERELTPFTEDRAPLVIALELTDSMLGTDQPPTRLERAKQKVADLLAARSGARTAVVAYAGSAHAVLPLTDDTDLVSMYLESLTPEVMPREGDRPDRALELAASMLAREDAPGTILFMSDGIDRGYADSFAAAFSDSADQLLVLAFGTEAGGLVADGGVNELAPPLDRTGLRAAASAGGGTLVSSAVDDSDIEDLNRRVQRHLVNAIESDENLQWRDAGYFLVWPLALFALLWFRRGWTVQWQ